MKISMYAKNKEIREFCEKNNLQFADVRLAQIYALYEFAEWNRGKIADYLKYSPSTVSTKRHYMWDYAELAEILFDPTEKYIPKVNPKIKAIELRNFKDGRTPVMMQFMEGCGENIKNEQAVYFFKFYNTKKELLFNKIGTSAKDVVGRLRDEIGDYSKKFDLYCVEIHRIRSCGDYPAEGAESALRAELIRQYPQAFRRNDRFFGVEIDPAIFDTIVNRFLS